MLEAASGAMIEVKRLLILMMLLLAIGGCKRSNKSSFSPPEPEYDSERLVLAPFGDASLARQQPPDQSSRRPDAPQHEPDDSAVVVLPPGDSIGSSSDPVAPRRFSETDSSFTFTTEAASADAARLAAIPRAPSTFDDPTLDRNAVLDAAILAFQQGKLDEAMSSARQAIAKFPDDARGHELLGMCLLNKNDFRKAVPSFDAAIRLQPKHAGLYVQRGSTYLRMGYPRRAEPDLTRAIEINPKDPVPYVWRSICHLNSSSFEEAIADASEALKFNSKIPDAYFVRCLGYLQTGRREKARVDFDSAVELGLDKNSRDMVAPHFETK